MTYCPIKRGLNAIAFATGKEDARTYPLEGAISAEDACDREDCGFWSKKEEACGVAAIANILTGFRSTASTASSRSPSSATAPSNEASVITSSGASTVQDPQERQT